MADVVIPLTNQPNQTFTTVVDVNGSNKTFRFFISWNQCGKYWEFDLFDDNTGEQYLNRIPLSGSGNLISQYDYKDIGRAFLVNVSGTDNTTPGLEDLGVNYFLVWRDNE